VKEARAHASAQDRVVERPRKAILRTAPGSRYAKAVVDLLQFAIDQDAFVLSRDGIQTVKGARLAAQPAECLAANCDGLLRIKISCKADDDALGQKVAAPVRVDLVAGKFLHKVDGADHRPPGGVGEHQGLAERFETKVVGDVLIHGNFFKDHAAFAP